MIRLYVFSEAKLTSAREGIDINEGYKRHTILAEIKTLPISIYIIDVGSKSLGKPMNQKLPL